MDWTIIFYSKSEAFTETTGTNAQLLIFPYKNDAVFEIIDYLQIFVIQEGTS
jgi:hypothetical protein